MIKLDLNIAIPECYYGRVVGRSGLANTPGFIVHDGVIDSDYHCIACVVLFNLSDEEYLVKTANRITQLTIERCFSQSLQKLVSLPKRKQSERKNNLVLQVSGMSCKQQL